jgi:hypothetical protein
MKERASMPGHGNTIPKPADQRARRNKDRVPTTTVEMKRAAQPRLGPSPHEDLPWNPRTVEWWKMWELSPLATDFTDADWEFLLQTALVHSRFWYGDAKQAAELRLRVQMFGVTPESRARLRIVFADAEEKDAKRTQTVASPGSAPGGGSSAGGGAYGNVRAIRAVATSSAPRADG